VPSFQLTRKGLAPVRREDHPTRLARWLNRFWIGRASMLHEDAEQRAAERREQL